MDRERRAALLAAKLGALVRERWGEAARRPEPFPGGAALAQAGRGWVLVDEQPARVLGGALGWARRHGVDDLHLLAPAEAAGGLARRAAWFRSQPHVWAVDGRALHPASPEPLPPDPPAPQGVETLVAAIEAAGAEVVVEHGGVQGEVLGLEVCRIVEGRIMVGVGKHDREAHVLAYGERSPLDALGGVIEEVRRFRRVGAPVHPANQLARERWLRAVVCAHPQMAGLPAGTPLRKVSSPVPRPDLRRPAPAPARGERVLVVCSTGVDVDLVPASADAWHLSGEPDELLIVVPEGDDVALTRDLCAMLRPPSEIVTVSKNWPAA